MRKLLAGAACIAFLFCLLLGMRKLPAVGEWSGRYGIELNHASVPERQASNVVSAVNFDFRALDTLGEETMLFAAVTALTLLLRSQRHDQPIQEDEVRPNRPHRLTTSAIRLLALFLLPVVVVFGFNLALHAQITPGGGFQGGAVLATALLQVYLVSRFSVYKKIFPEKLAEAGDAGGAALYALAGLLGLLTGATYLQNVLPLGKSGEFFSGGMIMLVNLGVALEVSCGFSLMMKEFIQQPFNRRPETGPHA